MTLNRNKRGLTSQDLVDIFTWLKTVQTNALKITGASITMVANWNDDIGNQAITINLAYYQAGDFTTQDVTNFISWITTNVTNALPPDTSIIKNFGWQP